MAKEGSHTKSNREAIDIIVAAGKLADDEPFVKSAKTPAIRDTMRTYFVLKHLRGQVERFTGPPKRALQLVIEQLNAATGL